MRDKENLGDLELRHSEVEFSADEDALKNGQMLVRGYVNETGKPSLPLGGRDKFIETISKGAFTRALDRKNDVDFLGEHDYSKLLSSTKNESLTLREDDKGLYMEAEIVDTSIGRDMYALIRSNLYSHMSFGFRTVKDNWEKRGEMLYRTIEDLILTEVSVVRNPAYPDSDISARGYNIIKNDDVVPMEFRSENMESIREQLTAIEQTVTQMKKEVEEMSDRVFKDNQEPEKKEETKETEDKDVADESSKADTETNEVKDEASEKDDKSEKDEKSKEDEKSDEDKTEDKKETSETDKSEEAKEADGDEAETEDESTKETTDDSDEEEAKSDEGEKDEDKNKDDDDKDDKKSDKSEKRTLESFKDFIKKYQ